MWYKEQIQLAILPRIFKGIKISYKGQYSLNFQLVHQSENGTRTSAYPYIFKVPLPNQKNSSKEQKQKKTGYTTIENNQGHFHTNSFKIVFQNQTQYLNAMCIFKLEYKIKKNTKGGKTYLLIHLQSHRNNIMGTKANPSVFQSKSVIKRVCSQKFYINRNNPNFNKFIEVEIQQNDYFSSLYMYIGNVYLGWKIRNNKMSLCQFLSLDNNNKKKILEMEKQYMKNESQVGKCIKQITKLHIKTIQQFYQMTIQKSIEQLIRLYQVYQQLNVYAFYPTSNMDILKQFHFHQTIKKQQFINQNIEDYFGCTNISSLYFAIHYENSLLVDNIKAIWQKVLKIVSMLNKEDFEGICNKEISKDEDNWKCNCIKYVFNTTNPTNMKSARERRSQIIGQKSTKSARSSTNLCMKSLIDPVDQQRTQLCHSSKNVSLKIPQIRNYYVEEFKKWRKLHIKHLNIHYDDDLNHPLIIVQNYSEVKKKKVQQDEINVNLVVFIHGFKGNQFDLERASEYLLKYNPYIEVLRIKNIFPDQDQSIEQMAKIAVQEIHQHLQCTFSEISKISIVGYSLGGIIGRAMLPYLQNYRHKMNLFVTFSSPHLGTYSSENSLVKAGIWYLIKIGKAKVIEQLNTCRDLKTANKSFMKKLSQFHQLQWFNKIILVSCEEDEFVPHISSRIEQQYENVKNQLANKNENKQFIREKKKEHLLNQQIIEMSKNIRQHSKKIERVQVWFDNEKKNNPIDKLTGRQSHIQFLDCCRFLKWFFSIYAHQF